MILLLSDARYDNEIFSKHPLNPRINIDVATTGFMFDPPTPSN